MDKHGRRLMRIGATGAVALGAIAGSYGIASAASGSGSSQSQGSLTLSNATVASSQASPPAAPQGWGQQRPDETLLTGDTASKVQAAAVARVPGATVSRVETDADGHAAYEVHMVKSDGTLVTVYVDKSFDVVSVQAGMPGPPPGGQGGQGFRPGQPTA